MCCNSAPDTSGINAAAQANAGISQQALDWYKQQYADQAPLRQQAIDTANKVSSAQLDAMNTETGIAKKDEAYRESVFQPLERGIVSDAENYDTLDRRDKAAGQAIADVTQQGAAQRAGTSRMLEAEGVNPSDGAYGAMQRSADTGITLGAVQAANAARDKVRTVGEAMKMDAANLGRGIASNQATEASLALNAGNAAANTGAAPVSIAGSGTQMVGQGFNTAIQGNQSAGNLYGEEAQIQNQANQANNAVFGALGSAAGAYLGNPAGFFGSSDKNQKEKRKPMKGEIALSIVKNLPVEKWRYKPGSPADDGGKEHVGPMAQDVRAKMGDAVAPGGKAIDLISMNGLNMAATKELSKRVAALEHVARKRKASA